MELKLSYNFDYLKQIFSYILIPVFIVLLVIIIGLFIYTRVEKDHTTERYNYTINFWSYLICLLLSATLFAIALSFVISLYKSIDGREVDNTKLIYLVYLSPLIPLVFLINTGIHWIKLFFNNKELDEQKEKIPQEENEELPQEEQEETPQDDTFQAENIEDDSHEAPSDDIFKDESKEDIPQIEEQQDAIVMPLPASEEEHDIADIEDKSAEIEELDAVNDDDIEVLDDDEGEKL